MAERLKDIIQNIRDSSNIGSANEMGIRQATVLPLLDTLGWDIRNLDEVIPEYIVGQNRVDYCLAVKSDGKVFIEVKAAREDLDLHREQLLRKSLNKLLFMRYN